VKFTESKEMDKIEKEYTDIVDASFTLPYSPILNFLAAISGFNISACAQKCKMK